VSATGTMRQRLSPTCALKAMVAVLAGLLAACATAPPAGNTPTPPNGATGKEAYSAILIDD
jgi:hypothetical protein